MSWLRYDKKKEFDRSLEETLQKEASDNSKSSKRKKRNEKND